MAATTAGTVPRFADPADYPGARARLADAGFTGQGITRRLMVASVPTAGVLNHPLYLWRTRGGDALDTFIRLFLLYSAVPAAAAREALAPMELQTWIEAGLLRPVEGSDDVEAAVRMLPYGPLVIVTDRPPRTEAEVPPDFVMSVGAATITLANATIRNDFRGRTLDLGCGCGTLGLLAAGHSREVLALDRNPRAVRFTEFNAALNGLANVRALEGNLFEPVADLAHGFGLIVCNPPFIISPESRYLYRDSGMRGDQICRTVVRGAPQYLAEAGFAQVLCNWAHLSGEDWEEHVSSWFDGSGCDAWVMRFETTDVAAYADAWVREGKGQREFEQWMAYYRQNRIEAVSLGLITMRRRSGRNWVRIEDAAKPARAIGTDVYDGMFARDFVEQADDEELMGTPLWAAPDTRIEQRLELAEGSWRVGESALYREGGMAPRGEADLYVASLIARCDGRRTLGELVIELAAELGRPKEAVAPAALGVVRQLILQGFLAPAQSA